MDGQTGHRTGTGEHGQGGYGQGEHGQGYTDGLGPAVTETYMDMKVFYK